LVAAVVKWVTSQHTTRLTVATTNHSALSSDGIRSHETRSDGMSDMNSPLSIEKSYVYINRTHCKNCKTNLRHKPWLP